MVIFINLFQRLQQLRRRLRGSDLLPILWAMLLLIFLGTLAYVAIEGWSWLDALYATIITITTVGYGDLSPQSVSGRLFAVFFTLIAIGVGGYAISSLAAYVIEGRARKIAYKLRKRRMKRIDALQGHYILCGADLLGLRIAEEFAILGVPYIIIEPDEAKLKQTLLFSHPQYFRQKMQSILDIADVDLSEYEDKSVAELGDLLDIPYLLEDPTDDVMLMRAGIDRAAGLVAAMSDDRDNLSIVVGARALARRYDNDQLRVMARVEDSRNVRKMRLSGADFVRIPAVMGGLEMATHVVYPEIGNWWYSVVGVNKAEAPRLGQVAVREKPHWVGMTVAELHRQEQVLTVSVKRNGDFLSPPPHDLALEAADIAIVMSQIRPAPT